MDATSLVSPNDLPLFMDESLAGSCSKPLTQSEIETYVTDIGYEIAYMVSTDGVGYDVYHIVYDDDLSNDNDLKYRVEDHINVRLDGDTLTILAKPHGEVLSLDEVLGRIRSAIELDLKTLQGVYGSRLECVSQYASYPVAKSLSELDIRFTHLLQEYEEEKNWFTAISLFLYVSVTIMVLQTNDIVSRWQQVFKRLVTVFGANDSGIGSGYRGQEAELDEFVAITVDLFTLTRRAISIDDG